MSSSAASLRQEDGCPFSAGVGGLEIRVGQVTDMVGRRRSAAAHRAVLTTREAGGRARADIETRVDIGRSLTKVALLLHSTGKTDEALAAFRRSESLLATCAGSKPRRGPALAACRAQMAHLLAYTGKTAEALAAFKLASRPGGADHGLAGPQTTPAATWRRLLTGSAYCCGIRASCRRRKRVPPGTGDPAEAGRRQPGRRLFRSNLAPATPASATHCS